LTDQPDQRNTSDTPDAHPSTRRQWVLDAVLVLAVTILIYLPALNNGFVDFDDPAYITENPRIQQLSWANLKAIWGDLQSRPYYPMVFTAYMVQYALWGENPAGFHAFSLALHALNAVLAYLLVWRLFRNRTAALISGLLMGTHPLHVDAVAWASDLKDVLSGTFVFLCLHAYVHYIQKGCRACYAGAIALYAMALFSKPMAALLPFMLLIVDYQQRRHDRRLELLEKVPFFAIAAALGYLALRAQAGVAPEPAADEMSFYSRANAWTAIGFYLLKLTVPINLSVLYASSHPGWWMVVATSLSIAFITATVWMLMLSRDYGFGLAWFVLLATPILGFIPFGYVVKFAPYANHFMYLADFGLFVVAGLICHDILKRLHIPADRATFYAIVTITFLLFGLKTALRCNVWRDSVTLWRDSVRYNRAVNSTVGHQRLAEALLAAGDREQAALHARKALERHPGNRRAQELLKEISETLPSTGANTAL
jgi:hypothetical protein